MLRARHQQDQPPPELEASYTSADSPRARAPATASAHDYYCASGTEDNGGNGNGTVAAGCSISNGQQQRSAITTPTAATTAAAASEGLVTIASDGSVENASAAAATVVTTERVDLEELFVSLYPPDLPEEDGLRASRNERLSKGYGGISLTYGETSVPGFLDVLERILHAHGGLSETGAVFYDLGCGTGKPVFAAATAAFSSSASHPFFRRCVGVEILSGLFEICEKALERWNGGANNVVALGGTASEIEFVCADFKTLDWSDGDLVFANSTCFDEDLMKSLARGAEELKEGAIVVTTTDRVPSLAFQLLEETVMVQAGRSATTCFIQRRLPKKPS